jgi:hypothetical protein
MSLAVCEVHESNILLPLSKPLLLSILYLCMKRKQCKLTSHCGSSPQNTLARGWWLYLRLWNQTICRILGGLSFMKISLIKCYKTKSFWLMYHIPPKLLAELIQAWGEILCTEIYKLTNSLWNNEELLHHHHHLFTCHKSITRSQDPGYRQ